MSSGFKPTVFDFSEIGWVDEHAEPKGAPELIAAAERLGARRKKLAKGEGGFFLQYTTMPPGFEVPLHSHDHDELLIVVAGGCTLFPDGPKQSVEMKALDSVTLAANHEYAFVCGEKGMEFYVVRLGEAGVTQMA